MWTFLSPFRSLLALLDLRYISPSNGPQSFPSHEVWMVDGVVSVAQVPYLFARSNRVYASGDFFIPLVPPFGCSSFQSDGGDRYKHSQIFPSPSLLFDHENHRFIYFPFTGVFPPNSFFHYPPFFSCLCLTSFP